MAADTGEDPFRRLPDDLLHHVVSFLPDDDALQTCVLDTQWRDLWKRTTTLHFDFYDSGPVFDKCQRFERSVNLIIQLRGNSPLVKCQIGSFPDEEDVERLVEHALMCQVEELIVRPIHIDAEQLCYDDVPFISHHLKILEFFNVRLEGSSLDFSNCPELEDLTMEFCVIPAPNISSKSLKHLCITNCCTFPREFRIAIVAPGLITLQLDDFGGLTPSLGYMPFLLSAYVGLSYGCHDFCKRNGQNCGDDECGCHAYPVDEGVLLKGLSNAVSLELIAKPKKFVYRWDLEWCPIFGKLKTLLLSDWFMITDVVCILQHSPVLELLTLQIVNNTEKLVTAAGARETIEQSFVCTHLKVVHIECRKVDEGIRRILRILGTCGILREQISIKDRCFQSESFSFQKPPHSIFAAAPTLTTPEM